MAVFAEDGPDSATQSILESLGVRAIRGAVLTEGLFLRTRWRFRHRRARHANAGPRAALSRFEALLCALSCGLLWPGAVLGYGLTGSYEDIQLGLTAGVAIAGGLACAVAWGYTRASVYGAGLAFMLIEGLRDPLRPCWP
ncbi:hypothetical protein G6F24_017081 [Rhizopus arrhizus]|nr:hypothetical protein G6F24_017081 [Rhizopus arrhizus]